MSYTAAKHHGAISMFGPQFQWIPDTLGGLEVQALCSVFYHRSIKTK